MQFGLWVCPYTNIQYKEASQLDIDHIVPLANAYISGGYLWTAQLKEQFANDMDNLLAVQSRANRVKSAKTPDRWRPPNKAYWRAYAFKWIMIKERYELSYTQAELNALFVMSQGE